MIPLLSRLLAEVPDGEVVDVRIGVRWTAVVVRVEGELRCGLSSTLGLPNNHGVSFRVAQAGRLTQISGSEIAALACEREQPMLASIGVAAINALLPDPTPRLFVDGNAADIITKCGMDKRVAITGHFPFIPQLRSKVAELHVLSLEPSDDDLPAEAAPEILPCADVVAITGQALINQTMDQLLDLCPSGAIVIVLGPSTPLSSVLFEYGVDYLCGSIIQDRDKVLRAVSEAGSFQQVHHAGVRLVTMENMTATRSAA